MTLRINLPSWEHSPEAQVALANPEVMENFYTAWKNARLTPSSPQSAPCDIKLFITALSPVVDRTHLILADLQGEQNDNDALRSISELLTHLEEGAQPVMEHKIRLALIGQTGVGKSTLFGALTKNPDPEKQSGGKTGYTHFVEAGQSAFSPLIEISDTPGVGAQNGEVHKGRALDAATLCDIVLWVTANESPVEKLKQDFIEILQLGRPVVLIQNLRLPLTQAGSLRSDAEKILERGQNDLLHQGREHANLWETIAKEVGYPLAKTLYVHAQAAFFGINNLAGDALLRISGMDDFAKHIFELLTGIPQNPSLKAMLQMKPHLDAIPDTLSNIGHYWLTEVSIKRKSATDLRHVVEAAFERCEKSIIKKYEQLRVGALQKVQDLQPSSREELEKAHDLIQSELRDKTQALLHEYREDIQKEVSEVIAQHQRDWAVPLLPPIEGLKIPRSFHRLIRHALNFILSIPSIIALRSSEPVSKVVGLIAGLVIDKFKTKINNWFTKMGLKTKSQEIIRRREAIRGSVQELSIRFDEHVLTCLVKNRNDSMTIIDKEIAVEDAELKKIESTAKRLLVEVAVLMKMRDELDKIYCTESLNQVKRTVPPNAIQNAAWIPRVCVLLSCDESVYVDLMLFSASSMNGEQFYATSQESIAGLTQLVRQFSSGEIAIEKHSDETVTVFFENYPLNPATQVISRRLQRIIHVNAIEFSNERNNQI